MADDIEEDINDPTAKVYGDKPKYVSRDGSDYAVWEVRNYGGTNFICGFFGGASHMMAEMCAKHFNENKDPHHG